MSNEKIKETDLELGWGSIASTPTCCKMVHIYLRMMFISIRMETLSCGWETQFAVASSQTAPSQAQAIVM